MQIYLITLKEDNFLGKFRITDFQIDSKIIKTLSIAMLM